MKRLRSAILLSLAALLATNASAIPTVTSISGVTGHGQTVTVAGNSFQTKSPAAPLYWANFDSDINPSALGQNTTWATTQQVSWTATEGYSGGGAKASDGNGVWIIGQNYSSGWNAYSRKMYWFRRQKLNFLITHSSQNWKDWRVWPSGGSGYPNIYTSPSNGGINVEGISSSGGFGDFNNDTTSWVVEENLFKASSASNVKDGYVKRRLNGVQIADEPVITRNESVANGSALMVRSYIAHAVAANKGSWSPAWSTSNRAWWDDLYLDSTFQRVMIGNASTFSACRKFGLLIPSAWSNTSITGVLHILSADFSEGSTAYLYVFDTDNNPNATGFPITIGATGGAAAAPTLDSLSPSNGPADGGTTVLAAGSGFVSGAQITVGGVAATGENVTSATSMTFVTPAGAASTSVDVIVFNPDTQNDTLDDGFTYDPEEATIDPVAEAFPWIAN